MPIDRRVTIRTGIAILIAFAASAVPTRAADDATALKDRLHAAEKTTTLSGDDMQPYYVKVAVQLFDAKGKPGEQGTVEVWWAGVGREKRVYAMPSYTATEIRRDGKLFRTPNAGYPPAMIEVLLREALHPMPTDSEIDASHPQMQKINFGKVPLECIMLAKPIQGLAVAPMGLFPTYCFDVGKSIPRADFNFGTQLIIRNTIENFQQRDFPGDITVSENNVMAARGQSAALETRNVADADLTTDGLVEVGVNAPVKTGAGVMQGYAISQPPPVYPPRAKENHVAGVVVLHALIGADGHVHDLEVVSSADPDLAIAALAAVRQWIYRPFTLNGAPVEVETTINVNFKFGP